MAHVSQEGAFGSIGAFGLVARRCQLNGTHTNEFVQVVAMLCKLGISRAQLAGTLRHFLDQVLVVAAQQRLRLPCLGDIDGGTAIAAQRTRLIAQWQAV